MPKIVLFQSLLSWISLADVRDAAQVPCLFQGFQSLLSWISLADGAVIATGVDG